MVLIGNFKYIFCESLWWTINFVRNNRHQFISNRGKDLKIVQMNIISEKSMIRRKRFLERWGERQRRTNSVQLRYFFLDAGEKKRKQDW